MSAKPFVFVHRYFLSQWEKGLFYYGYVLMHRMSVSSKLHREKSLFIFGKIFLAAAHVLEKCQKISSLSRGQGLFGYLSPVPFFATAFLLDPHAGKMKASKLPPPLLGLLFIGNFTEVTRADASAELAVAMLRAGTGGGVSPPCSPWIRGGSGDIGPELISATHEKVEDGILNSDSLDGIMGRIPCIPCFSLVSGAKVKSLGGGVAQNKCNKVPHVNFHILLSGSPTSNKTVLPHISRTTTHLIRSIGRQSTAVEVNTLCPNVGSRFLAIWRVGESVFHLGGNCPHPLFGTRQRVSIMGTLPYVYPAARVGSDFDLLEIVAEKLGFEPDFKVERTIRKVVEGVANGTSTFGLGHLAITYQFTFVVDATQPSYVFEMMVTTAKPKPLTPFFNLLRPFSLKVWVLIILVIPCTMVAMYLLLDGDDGSSIPEKMWSCFHCVVGSITGQGVCPYQWFKLCI